MTLRSRNALAWITVQTVFAISGACALFVGAKNARCGLPDLFETENGPFGRAADDGVDHQALFDIGRWSIIVGMTLAIGAVLLGMFASWKNQVHLRTLLTLMALAGTQAIVTIAFWSIQIEQHAFCGASAATIIAAVATAALLIAAIAFAMSRTTLSSYDLVSEASATSPIAGSVSESSRTSTSDTATATRDTTVSPTATSPTAVSQAAGSALVIQMAGHGGAGKSTVARELAGRLDATVLDLDVIKSELLDAGASWESASSDSYETIYRHLDGLLAAADCTVIVDTPSYWPEIHERLVATAQRHGARYVFVECIAAPATRAARLANRTPLRSQAPGAGENPSDAPSDLGDVHARVVAAPSDATVLVVDTERAVDFDSIVARLA